MIRWRIRLHKNGIFSDPKEFPDGLNHENYECVMLWRTVLDEMLKAMVSPNTSAAEHSQKWFNAQPGDTDYYLHEYVDEQGNEVYEEEKVDAYDEFCEVCANANLDPHVVQRTAHETYINILKESEDD